MNFDLALIAAVLETRDLGSAVSGGVRAKMLGDEAFHYWEVLRDHYDAYQEVPTVEYFQAVCPNYEHHPPKDSLTVIIDGIKTRYLHSEMEVHLLSVAETLQAGDAWKARKQMAHLAEMMAIEIPQGTTDLVAGEDKERVLKRVDMLAGRGGILGYPWPWDYLNDKSVGLLPGNFVYFYGREKSKKTFLMIYLAIHWVNLGYRVLFVTREMPIEEIAWRVYAMRARLPYRGLMKGDLTSDGRITLEDAMDSLYADKHLIVSEVDGGISGLRAKIEEVRPAIVIHDYMKALADDEMGDKMNGREHTYIARVADRLKRLAMNPALRVPIIACGHANRLGATTKGKSTLEVGHSDHIMRKVDLGARVISSRVSNRTAIIVNTARNMEDAAWTVDGTLCNGFGDFISTSVDWVESEERDQKDAEKDRESKEKEMKGALDKFKAEFNPRPIKK